MPSLICPIYIQTTIIFNNNIVSMLRLFCQTLKQSFSKRILYNSDCTSIISATASQISRIAALTLGPMGRNVLIQNEKQLPRITKDGVTVVKHIEYEDRLKDAICTLIKKSVNSTNKFAGDGTTTSTILIGELVTEGMKMLEIGESVRDIKEGLMIGRKIGIDFMRTASQPISTEEEFYQVAMIATKGDKQLSKYISQAVSVSDLIKIQKSQTHQSYLEYYNGVKIVAGIPHPQFKNKGDNVELDYPLVMISTKGIKGIEQVLGVLELAKKARKAILIISSSISDSVLSTLIYNNRKQIVEAYPLILREYGTVSQEYFKQLAKTTGATIFNDYGPCDIKDIKFQHLGKAVRVDMDQIQSTIVGKSQEKCNNAVIYAGGATEAIALQVYDKLVDALNSVKTSKKHGVIAGGGITYWRLADLLDQYEGEHKAGVKLLAKALRAPRKKLIEGLPEYYQALGGTGWQAYHFKTRQLEDMFKVGVVDSAIVGESVLVDSISLSHMLLDISVCIVRSSLNNQSQEFINNVQQSYKI